MNNDDRVAKLVDTWAMRLEGNVLEGIEQLNEAYKDDKMMAKALMSMVALQYPQFSDAITSYFYIVEKDGTDSDDPVPFNFVKEHIYTQLTTISLLLQLGENMEAKEHMEEIIKHLCDFVHELEIAAPKAQAWQELSENIHKSIKTSGKHLDRFGDFVIVADQDKLLKEMIAFKKTLAVLEEQLQDETVKETGSSGPNSGD